MAKKQFEKDCRQDETINSMKIQSAVLQTNFNTMVKEITDIKTDIKSINLKLDNFFDTADRKYATKAELSDLKDSVVSNTNKIWRLSKEVAQWGTLVALMTKLAGLW